MIFKGDKYNYYKSLSLRQRLFNIPTILSIILITTGFIACQDDLENSEIDEKVVSVMVTEFISFIFILFNFHGINYSKYLLSCLKGACLFNSFDENTTAIECLIISEFVLIVFMLLDIKFVGISMVASTFLFFKTTLRLFKYDNLYFSYIFTGIIIFLGYFFKTTFFYEIICYSNLFLFFSFALLIFVSENLNIEDEAIKVTALFIIINFSMSFIFLKYNNYMMKNKIEEFKEELKLSNKAEEKIEIQELE
ncbi:hypothetical protein NUSPORA_01875 [Nucleospora cyclopteri]